MSASLRARVAPLLGLALLLTAAPLRAQTVTVPLPIGTTPAPSDATPAPPAKPVTTPPKLKKFVEATYPEAALRA
jgi:hypothetical protein